MSAKLRCKLFISLSSLKQLPSGKRYSGIHSYFIFFFFFLPRYSQIFPLFFLFLRVVLTYISSFFFFFLQWCSQIFPLFFLFLFLQWYSQTFPLVSFSYSDIHKYFLFLTVIFTDISSFSNSGIHRYVLCFLFLTVVFTYISFFLFLI